MDSQLAAASRALASGDALAALNYIALRDDPPSLALRGIAMAQLNDLDRARKLLRRAARGFGPRETIARARCLVAEAEIALVLRDLTWPPQRLDSAVAALQRGGDRANAAHAGYLAIRRLVLIGRLDEAEQRMQSFDSAPLAAASRVAYHLVAAGVATRRLHAAAARDWLRQAESVARQTRIASLIAEVEDAARRLELPAARLIASGRERLLLLDDVEALLASNALVIDARRLAVRSAAITVPLATRPVLLILARVLAEAWPDAASREAFWRARFAPGAPTSRTARDCVSRSAACARRSPASLAFERLKSVSRWSPAAIARSLSSRRRRRSRTRTCWPCWRTARRGRVRRSPWRSASARAPSSARSTGLSPPARRNLWDAAARAVGWRRRRRVSRQACYSLSRRKPARVGA